MSAIMEEIERPVCSPPSLSRYTAFPRHGIVIALLLNTLPVGQCFAQAEAARNDPSNRQIRAMSIEQVPVLDGRLDDEVWQLVEPVTGFTQRNPVEGTPATQRTEIRILYTPEVLYIGARMYESDTRRLVVTQMRRDSQLNSDDHLGIVIDTFHDQRNGFEFRVNPAGARYDAYIMNEGMDVNRDFNAVWDVRTSVDGEGWTAEISIPLSQLRFPDNPGDQVWGINFCRVIRHNNEDVYWVPVPRDFGSNGFFRFSNVGRLVGLQGLHQGTNLQIKPYVMSGISATRELNVTPGVHRLTRDAVADIGLDVKHVLTSNLVLDLTFNTDFAQVEADQKRVNLTRFSLYYPEKRDFFLEGATTFAAGIGGQELQLFYSRRIGLYGNREVPILAGSKITGRAGPWTVGALSVLTDQKEIDTTTTVSRTLWSVISLRRNILRRSSIGVLMMSKDELDGGWNRTAGIDANLALGNNTSVIGQIARVFDPDLSGNTFAGTGAFNWSTDLYGVRVSYRQVGDDFKNEMGFIRRLGVRESSAQLTYSPRPGRWGIRQIRSMLSGSYLADASNRLLTRSLQLKVCNFLENTGKFCPGIRQRFELLDRVFTIYRDPDSGEQILIEPGKYEWMEFSAPWSTDTRKKLTLGGSVGIGGYFGGKKVSASLKVTLRPNTQLTGSLSINRDMLRELGADGTGKFDANTLSLLVNYAFSPSLFTKAYVQYHDSQNAVVSNFLLHWIIRDGTEIYLVYNEVYDTSPDPFSWAFDPLATNRTLLLKATYMVLR